MKRFPLRSLSDLIICFGFILQTVSAQAQTTTATPLSDPQAMALAVQSLSAMGSAPEALPLADSRANGVLTMYFGSPVQLKITLESKGLTQTRIEVQQAIGTSVQVMNGGQAAIQNPDGSIHQLVQVNLFAERVGHIPALSMLAEIHNPIALVEMISTSAANNSPDDVIAVRLGQSSDPIQLMIQQRLSRTLFYINHASGFVDKVDYGYYSESPNPGRRMEIQDVFSDYRNIGGVAVPFHRTTYCDGRLESDLQLSSVNFNVGVPATDFVVPGGAQ
jgi:hypothetical protein